MKCFCGAQAWVRQALSSRTKIKCRDYVEIQKPSLCTAENSRNCIELFMTSEWCWMIKTLYLMVISELCKLHSWYYCSVHNTSYMSPLNVYQ